MLLRGITPDTEEIIVDERRKYLRLVVSRYVKDKRAERGQLLTEMGKATGLHRNSLLRLMHLRNLERVPKKPRFKNRQYGAAAAHVARVVWERLDHVCAERLTGAI
jgi:hypothetical protein